MQLSDVVLGIKANEHAKVLIVGVRGDNFPPRYHQHPQLLFWETDQAMQATIPQAVRLICPTRFINHGLWSRLQNEAIKRGITLVHLSGTGEIKALLDPIIPQREVPEVKTPVVTAPPAPAPLTNNVGAPLRASNGRLKPGVLQEWVRAHVEVPVVMDHKAGTRTGATAAEAKRLEDVAKAEGIVTTWASIATVIRVLRREWQAKAKSQDAYARRVATRKANAEKVAAAPPVVNGGVKAVAAQTAAIADDDRELLLMARDAIAALELIKGKLEDRAQKKARLFEALKDL